MTASSERNQLPVDSTKLMNFGDISANLVQPMTTKLFLLGSHEGHGSPVT